MNDDVQTTTPPPESPQEPMNAPAQQTERVPAPEPQSDPSVAPKTHELPEPLEPSPAISPEAPPESRSESTSQDNRPTETTIAQTSGLSNDTTPSAQEPQIQERIVEKTIPRELTEEEKTSLYRTRLKTLSVKGNQARTDKRKAAYGKILAYIREHGFASNNEIQKHCGIGDSTATRYLRDLEKQGLILKIGRTRNIRWRLRQGTP